MYTRRTSHLVDTSHAMIVVGIIIFPIIYFGVLFLAILIAGSAR